MGNLRMWLNSNARVNREHNLFVSESKHFYEDAKGRIRYQKKPLDRRTSGSRKILTRLLVLDVDTGAMYGELHDDETANQLADFLLRAWHPKVGHYFRGTPNHLNVPAKVLSDPKMYADLQVIVQPSGIASVDQLPSGFAAGIYALRNFEDRLGSSLWGHDDVELSTLQAISANVSYLATASAYDGEEWDEVPPLSMEAKRAVQSLYGEDYWCEGQFQYMFPPELAKSCQLDRYKSADLVSGKLPAGPM